MSHLAAKRFTIESPDYKHGRWCGRGVEITNAQATTGLMAAAVDSYFYVAGMIPKGTPMRILPLANNFHKYYQFDQDDFSYRTMKKLVAMKPDMILDEHCERELAKGGTKERLLHPEAILQGEKTLGALRLALKPGYPGLEAEHAVHLTTEPEKTLIKALGDGATLRLPSVTTTSEGYAVVAMRLQYPHNSKPELWFKSGGDTWRKAERPIFPRNPDILYFQIITNPRTTVTLRMSLGIDSGIFTVLTMPFLDDVEGI